MTSRLLWLPAIALMLAGPTAQAASWSVDRAKSTLGFVGSQGGSSFDGRFTQWNAAIDFDPANPGGSHALVTIDMASASTGDSSKDQALPQSDWFDIKSFPQAKFEATSFRAIGGDRYEAVGTLTIRGVTKSVVLPFVFDQQGGRGHAKGRLDLVRTDYGVGQGAWSTEQAVGLSVAVTIDIQAEKAPPKTE